MGGHSGTVSRVAGQADVEMKVPSAPKAGEVCCMLAGLASIPSLTLKHLNSHRQKLSVHIQAQSHYCCKEDTSLFPV